jgi:hypothetical protein
VVVRSIMNRVAEAVAAHRCVVDLSSPNLTVSGPGASRGCAKPILVVASSWGGGCWGG